MNLLALDTSSIACSVAASQGGEVIDRHVEGAREHTKILMPMINSVMREAGLGFADLDAIVLGNGPGSFIGMRIGASVAQGIAYAAGLGIAPVSSLLAVAAAAFDELDGDRVVVTQDARMNEVYWGVYRRGEPGIPIAESPECIVPARHTCTSADLFIAAGGGWDRYAELMAGNAGRVIAMAASRFPRARSLLAPGAHLVRCGETVDPPFLEPAYLRNRVAEPGP